MNLDRCKIPTVYCGMQDKQYPYYDKNNKYVRQGTQSECMRKGFGASMAIQTKKSLREDNLQQIRYVGTKFNDNFIAEGIRTIPELLNRARILSIPFLDRLLRKVFTNANGTLNGKGYNSVILFLYDNGLRNLPECDLLQNP